VANKLDILVDLNIILDVVSSRVPHAENSIAVWRTVETGQVIGFLAAHSITTLFYLSAKQIGRQRATAVLHKTLQVFVIAPVNDLVIRDALSWGWRDFEDAVQMATAVHANLNYLITRNTKDFESQPVPILKPAHLFALLSQQK